MAVLAGWDLNSRKLAGAFRRIRQAAGKTQNQEPGDPSPPSALPLKGPLTWASPLTSLNLSFFIPKLGMLLPVQPNCRSSQLELLQG